LIEDRVNLVLFKPVFFNSKAPAPRTMDLTKVPPGTKLVAIPKMDPNEKGK